MALLEKKYPDKKKGIFMPNDTHANVLLNYLFQKYGSFRKHIRLSVSIILRFPEKLLFRRAQWDSRFL